MRAGAELGREANPSFSGPLVKERTRGRETGLVGFLNSNPSYERDVRGTETDQRSEPQPSPWRTGVLRRVQAAPLTSGRFSLLSSRDEGAAVWDGCWPKTP